MRNRGTRVFLILFALLAMEAALMVACPPPVSLKTPEGKAAFAADQLLIRVGELQDAAIAANGTIDPDTKSPVLSEATTRRIVQVSMIIATTLNPPKDKDGKIMPLPTGWQVMVTTAWTNLKVTLHPDEVKKLSVYIASIDVLIGALAPATGGVQ